ncbi:MAG: MotA/TolQ/ExbB proton channel family protein [Bacteroidetes bacterium]|nr:MotA/TolQ/ExbB proton channel family protein [Bacteroidota bacterium]MDA0943742.1 MotA/TolQ/ExbB proton channel family protein [Bacteroidota bacterium]MDA1111423.1 MotA/TolQ/ExbB proton channel family protein [Bacteroidota bacterium]
MSLLIQLLQAGADTSAAAGATEHVSAPIVEIMAKGGMVMALLALSLLIAIYFIVERFLYLKSRAAIDFNLISVVKDNLKENRPDAALAYCERTHTAQAQVIGTGLRFLGSNMREIESAMETKANVELSAMEGNLHYLSLISRIAPMLGFVGTIWGVINIFYSISTTGDLSIGAISGGLYTKMVASFAGLLVGMIAFFGYQMFMRRIDKFAERLQEQSLSLLEMLTKSNL